MQDPFDRFHVGQPFQPIYPLYPLQPLQPLRHMRITGIETIVFDRALTVHAGSIGWLWVRLHTDEGLIGLGETYPAPAAAEAVVHESFARPLLGQDARNRERLWSDLFLAVSYHGWAGAEMRALSAVDLALWDLAGKAAGQPVYRLLGGRSRERIRTYNTCYDHVFDFRTDADRLARDLAGPGDHGDEDLAVRRDRARQSRPVHHPVAARSRPRADPQDS